MLQRINLETFEDRINWLWDKVKDQTYAFDDTVKGNAGAFLRALCDPASAHWCNDSGMVSLMNIQQKVNADIHFLCWDADYSRRQILENAKQTFREAFEEFELQRITATVPSFNQQVGKMCLHLGMKYEGAMRSCFLHEGIYHSLMIYGLLRSEFEDSLTRIEEVADGRSY